MATDACTSCRLLWVECTRVEIGCLTLDPWTLPLYEQRWGANLACAAWLLDGRLSHVLSSDVRLCCRYVAGMHGLYPADWLPAGHNHFLCSHFCLASPSWSLPAHALWGWRLLQLSWWVLELLHPTAS